MKMIKYLVIVLVVIFEKQILRAEFSLSSLSEAGKNIADDLPEYTPDAHELKSPKLEKILKEECRVLSKALRSIKNKLATDVNTIHGKSGKAMKRAVEKFSKNLDAIKKSLDTGKRVSEIRSKFNKGVRKAGSEIEKFARHVAKHVPGSSKFNKATKNAVGIFVKAVKSITVEFQEAESEDYTRWGLKENTNYP